ncbi:MAG: hypothetical protein R6X12_10605 [bacterium]
MTALIIVAAMAASPVPVGRAPLAADGRTFHSPSRRFRAEVEHEARLGDFVPFRRFELRDAGGRLVYSRPGEGLTVLDISDQGAVVGAAFDGPVSGRAQLRFFGPAGTETGTAEVGFYGERAFSADGSRFLVNDGAAGLVVFSAAGRELGNLGPAYRFAASADAGLVAVTRGDTLALYRDCELRGRAALPTRFIRELALSPDGGLVGWVERHGLRVLRTDDLAEVADWRPVATDPEPVSLDLAGPGGPVLVGLGKSQGRCAVLLLGADGAERWRSESVRENWNARTPRVRFGAGRTFAVEWPDEVETWRLEEE